MKKILSIAIISLIGALGLAVMIPCAQSVAAATAQASDKDKQPVIKFKNKSHDFGTIKEADGKVTCSFEFTNTGDAPLIIIAATAGCGCTRPSYESEPIAPGKTSEIRVTYNPKGRPGEFNKNVTVKTNAPAAKKVTLKISGTVVPVQ